MIFFNIINDFLDLLKMFLKIYQILRVRLTVIVGSVSSIFNT